MIWIKDVITFVEDNYNILALFLCWAYLDKINTANDLGLYKKKSDYFIERNVINKEIREIKARLK